MRLRPRYSDDEYVGRIQFGRGNRPGVAAAMLSALLFGTLAGFLLHVTQSGMFPLFATPEAQSSFQLGLFAGFAIGLIFFAAILIFILTLHVYFGGRGDRLLVAYHRRLAELGELPLKSSGVAY